MKKLLLICILLISTGCAGLYTNVRYRIRDVEEGYELKKNGVVYLTKTIREVDTKIGGVYIDINISNSETLNNGNDILYIVSDKATDYIDGKVIYSKEGEYEYIELPEGVTITKKDGEKIKIGEDKIKYTYKEDPNTHFKEAEVYIPETLSGPIVIELGKIKINGKEYKTPKIYMQKYKDVESWSLLGAIFEQSPSYRGTPLYHSEKWVDD